ncbi:hypothetical protein OFN63_27810, partial [Escherichia coli]|nr:hypothetical protein [Escherichia coli]
MTRRDRRVFQIIRNPLNWRVYFSLHKGLSYVRAMVSTTALNLLGLGFNWHNATCVATLWTF